jgi:hypothetical protein
MGKYYLPAFVPSSRACKHSNEELALTRRECGVEERGALLDKEEAHGTGRERIRGGEESGVVW